MNISEFNLYTEDNRMHKSIHLIYRGNENIIIRQIIKMETNNPIESEILIPRNLFENFMRLINES